MLFRSDHRDLHKEGHSFPTRRSSDLLRQGHDVLALIQSVHGHLPKGLRKLAHAFLGHRAPPPYVKCANSPCLNLGDQSMAM